MIYCGFDRSTITAPNFCFLLNLVQHCLCTGNSNGMLQKTGIVYKWWCVEQCCWHSLSHGSTSSIICNLHKSRYCDRDWCAELCGYITILNRSTKRFLSFRTSAKCVNWFKRNLPKLSTINTALLHTNAIKELELWQSVLGLFFFAQDSLFRVIDRFSPCFHH